LKLTLFKNSFHHYNRLSIAKKLQFIGVTTLALVGNISIVLILLFEFYNERHLLESHVKTLSMVIADNIAPALLFDDKDQVQKILQTLQHKQEVQYAYVYNEKHQELGAYQNIQSRGLDRDCLEAIKSSDTLIWEGLQLYIQTPVKADGQVVGTVVIVASIYAFIYQMLIEILILLLIVTIAILATYKHRKKLLESILGPIGELNALTSEIIKTKNLRTKIPVYNEDEIGELAKNFNVMLEKLDLSHSELNRQKDTLAYKAHHDALTGLPNRALFNDRLEQAISKARRHKEEIAIFFIDLDHFKEINDTLGHEMGDEVLKFFAQRLKDSVRTEDTIARMGGDEFMVIMENLQTSDAISVVANKIVSIVKEPIVLGEKRLHLGASIGISVYPHNGESSEVLLKNADSAMYKAKDAGRDNYQFYTPEMKAHAQKRKETESMLQAAIQDEALILKYAPRFNATQGEVVAYEVVVIWRHPEKGDLEFKRFRQLASEMGLIGTIESWLLQKALQELASWQKKGVKESLVLRLSISHMMKQDFFETIEGLLQDHGIEASAVELVIEGKELSEHQEVVTELFERLQAIGFVLCVSDFGLANTSLGLLSHLPVNRVEVATPLVEAYENEEKALSAIVAVAASLNLSLLASTVETHKQKVFLQKHGFTFMQGGFCGGLSTLEEILDH